MISEEARPYFDFEEAMKPYMDKYYKSIGLDTNWESDIEKDVIISRGEKSIKVELKFRTSAYDDILVEIVQDIRDKNWGWFCKTGADQLHYVVCVNNRPSYYHMIAMDQFRLWFLLWLPTVSHPHFVFSAKGYGSTINIAVPLSEIPGKYYKTIHPRVWENDAS